MSWHPNDLVTDQDLIHYESKIMSQFGQSSWLDLRTKALEDWLWPILRSNGLDPLRFRTRYEPEQVFAYTAAAYTDITAAAKDATEDDINLAAILATPGTDAIYIGSVAPFRGIHWRLLDNVNSAASVFTVQYWADAWTNLVVLDKTQKTAGKPLSGGGSMTWGLVPDWTIRTLNSSDPRYWVRVTCTATPTGAKAAQIGVVRRSVLAAPATLRTLMLIFRAAPTGNDGPWVNKGDYYEKEADLAMQRALALAGGEFDTANATTPSDLISATEADQTTEMAAGGRGWTWERG